MREIAGTHLIIDAYVRNSNVLSKQNILQVFSLLIEELKMECLGRPIVRELPVQLDRIDSDQDEGGISVISPITTSHLALHGWPIRSAVMLDAFSCKPFDAQAAFKLLDRNFGFSAYSLLIVDRVDPKTSLPIVTRKHSGLK